MEKLFMLLLDKADDVSKITEASLYKGATCAHIKGESQNGEYEISIYISKKEEEKVNG